MDGRVGGWIESPPQITHCKTLPQIPVLKGEEVCALINCRIRYSSPFTMIMLSPVASVKLSHVSLFNSR